MKKGKYLLTLAVLCLLFAMLAPCCFAGGNYELTVHSGQRGTIAGADEVTLTNSSFTNDAAGNYRVNLEGVISQAKVTDDRYYVKGIRLAGHDNNEALVGPNASVTGDEEYVLVYAIKGDMVEYTVKYLSADGRALAEETKGYTNKGDKIVVGAKDVDGYVPNAYNLTKTVTENEAENVLTFRYTAAPAQQNQVIVLPAQNNNNANNNANANNANNNNNNANANANNGVILPDGGNANANDNANADADAEAAAQEPAGLPIAEAPAEEAPAVEATPVPQEIIDLDEEEVPLANIEDVKPSNTAEQKKRTKTALIIALLVLETVLAIVLYFYLRNRKRFGDQLDDEYEELDL